MDRAIVRFVDMSDRDGLLLLEGRSISPTSK